MYPAQLFSLYPPFPREDKVFVAMSFDSRFDLRWRNVIEPVIRDLRFGDRPLEPVRVDTRRIGDSILTEILNGIGKSRLVFADITSIGMLDGRHIRNANVLYEVGLAHAVRLPEEVVIFRSDRAPLLFDVSNIRVNEYLPDEDSAGAKDILARTLADALREVDLRRHLAVTQTAEMLDHTMYFALSWARAHGELQHPPMRTMGNVVGNAPRISAINRLLELGLLRSRAIEITPELLEQIGDVTDFSFLTYECTEFGVAVCTVIAERVISPDLRIQMTRPDGAEATAASLGDIVVEGKSE